MALRQRTGSAPETAAPSMRADHGALGAQFLSARCALLASSTKLVPYSEDSCTIMITRISCAIFAHFRGLLLFGVLDNEKRLPTSGGWILHGRRRSVRRPPGRSANVMRIPPRLAHRLGSRANHLRWAVEHRLHWPGRRRRSTCQWQPKTARFWQLKTAHFGRGHFGPSGHALGEVPGAFWPGRRERSDRSPGRNAPGSGGAGGHFGAPSRCCSAAALSQC